MGSSIWDLTLESFNAGMAAPEPAPAAGAAAAVSARLSVSLLLKILDLSRAKEKNGPDASRLEDLMEKARLESAILAKAADDDSAAFAAYLERVRSKAAPESVEEAMLRAIEVPLSAAQSCVRSLELCYAGVEIIRTSLAVDVGAAALLLEGAVRSLLAAVDYNRRQLRSPERVNAHERMDIEERAKAETAKVLRRVGVDWA